MRTRTSLILSLLRFIAAPAAAQILAAGFPTSANSQATWATVNLWLKWPGGAAPGAPADDGYWGPVINMPGHQLPQLYNVHAALLYDGSHAKLVMFRNDLLSYDLDLSPPDEDGTILDLNGLYPFDQVQTPNGHEVFCAGYTPLSDGRLLVVGGPLAHGWSLEIETPPCDGEPVITGWASIVDPLDMSSVASCWTATDNLDHETGSFPQPQLPCGEAGYGDDVWNTGRYYPTCTLLEDGRVLVTAGDYWTDCIQNGCLNPDVGDEYSNQPIWAVYDPLAAPGSRWTWDDLATSGGTFTNPWAAVNGDDGRMFSYPHVRVLPYGLFYHGNDSSGEGTPGTKSHLWTPLANWADSPIHIENQKLRNRVRSTCIILTLDAASDSVSVLLVGGAAYNSQNIGAFGSELITYHKSPNSPTVTSTGWHSVGSMQSGTGRRDGNSVLLPDGRVLTIGGEGNTNVTQNRDCEIFTANPAGSPMSGTWEQVAALSVDRGHHSVALLLPDGRVISSGHENGALQPLGTNYHIYYPPNLFRSDGTLAPRDTVELAPSIVRYGLPFEITLKDDDAADIDEICLMAPCAVTHTTNFSQSRVLLSHSTVPGDPERLVVSGPKDSTYAQPGYFMLFALDDGVPSDAKWVKVERQNNSDYVIGSGETVRWGNDVWLDRDVEVEKGGTLEILPGTTVHVKANTDRANRGVSASKTEIIHGGTTKAIGTEADPIVFTTYDGAGVAGEWYGHRFILQGCERSGYGYMGAVNPPSVIEHAAIENAEYGVKIEDFVAPSLKSVTFADITGDRDVYLDRTDVYLAQGYWTSGECGDESCNPIPCPFVVAPIDWKLLPGTNVVASNTSLQDGWYGDSGKVDLVAQAKFDVLGAENDSVFFRPETPTLETGDGWGGAILDIYAAGSLLKYMSIGQAPNPLFVFYADSTLTIRHSRIHHFADTGLWMDETGPLGAVVDSSVIERGAGMSAQSGFTAVRLDQTDELGFVWNKLDVSGLNIAGTSSALDVFWGSTHCQYPATGFDNFVVRKNWMLGSGTGAQGSRSAAKFFYLCGSSTRYVTIDGNYIEDFNANGLEMHQTKEAQFTCNTVLDVARGLDFWRTSDITGQAVKFLRNWFEVKSGDQQVVRTDDNVKTAFGPAGSDRGDNGLLAVNTQVKFVKEQDPNVGDKIDTRDCYWYLYDGSTQQEVLIDDPLESGEISSRLDPATDVLFKPFRVGSPFNYCRPSSPPGAGGQARRVHPPRVASDPERDSGATSATESGEAPETAYLIARRQTHARATEIRFGIPHLGAGAIRLEIFDVTGRRARSLVNDDIGSGRFAIMWDETDEGGSRLSAGIYFVRLGMRESAITTKLVVVR